MTQLDATCRPTPKSAFHWYAGACLAAYFLTALLPNTGLFSIPLQAFRGALFFLIGFLTLRAIYLASDEFQRILQTRALLFALTLTMALTCIYGHAASFAARPLPPLPITAIPIFLFVTATFAKVLLFRKASA